MFVWALLLLAFAFLAALFAFTGIALETAGFARIVFIVALGASGVTYLLSQARRL